MYCNTSIIMQLTRGVLAVACIAGAIALASHTWLFVGLLASAVYLMRGCPACWLTGLIEAIGKRSERQQPSTGHDALPPPA